MIPKKGIDVESLKVKEGKMFKTSKNRIYKLISVSITHCFVRDTFSKEGRNIPNAEFVRDFKPVEDAE